MALAPILDLVKKRLPFLVSDDDALITDTKEEVFYDYFVSQLERPEGNLSDESLFSIEERLFWADITAYNLAVRIASGFKKSSSNLSSSTSGAVKEIEKAKADVVEVTYKIISDEQAGRLYLSSGDVIQRILYDVCTRASRIGVTVPACALLYPAEYDVPSFVIIE